MSENSNKMFTGDADIPAWVVRICSGPVCDGATEHFDETLVRKMLPNHSSCTGHTRAE